MCYTKITKKELQRLVGGVITEADESGGGACITILCKNGDSYEITVDNEEYEHETFSIGKLEAE